MERTAQPEPTKNDEIVTEETKEAKTSDSKDSNNFKDRIYDDEDEEENPDMKYMRRNRDDSDDEQKSEGDSNYDPLDPNQFAGQTQEEISTNLYKQGNLSATFGKYTLSKLIKLVFISNSTLFINLIHQL